MVRASVLIRRLVGYDRHGRDFAPAKLPVQSRDPIGRSIRESSPGVRTRASLDLAVLRSCGPEGCLDRATSVNPRHGDCLPGTRRSRGTRPGGRSSGPATCPWRSTLDVGERWIVSALARSKAGAIDPALRGVVESTQALRVVGVQHADPAAQCAFIAGRRFKRCNKKNTDDDEGDDFRDGHPECAELPGSGGHRSRRESGYRCNEPGPRTSQRAYPVLLRKSRQRGGEWSAALNRLDDLSRCRAED